MDTLRCLRELALKGSLDKRGFLNLAHDCLAARDAPALVFVEGVSGVLRHWSRSFPLVRAFGELLRKLLPEVEFAAAGGALY